MGYVLAVDQGTTGTTVLVVREDGAVVGRGYEEHPQSFPAPGLVEHDPHAIWASALAAGVAALAAAGIAGSEVAAVGITNQRETLVAWDGLTGKPLAPAIVWQDRRTADLCEHLRAEGHDRPIRELSGLPVDPYFSGTKAAWLLQHSDDVKHAADAGTLRFGTIDSWLVWNMTGGQSHVTDASNAARTMLYDIHLGRWSLELCELFGVDTAWLPTVVDSSGVVAECDAACFLGVSASVAGIAGDQQAALFGQGCFDAGQAKATYGTGAFVLVNTGVDVPVTDALISTVAWRMRGRQTFALEGSVFTAGASVQWLRDGMQIIDSSPDIEALARGAAPGADGVTLVPAFAGLGAPIWDPDARATLLGMTRGTGRAQLARATLEGVACRVRQTLDAMAAEGTEVRDLRVDGGMAANDLFLQIQADLIGQPVLRPANVESTSIGAAQLAMLGVGIASSIDDLAAMWSADRSFEPSAERAWVEPMFERFTRAVELVQGFHARPASSVQKVL